MSLMKNAGVTEGELRKRGEIVTKSGQTLSFAYLSYVREHPISWSLTTEIIYGENDALVPYPQIAEFAERSGARISVLNGGEHWFHTKEQMEFITAVIKNCLQILS